MNTICSALFIDFDNIYGGLEADYDASVARSFATNPRKWIDWLSSFGGTTESHSVRRILLRKCYLNPTRFARYRLDFTHAACEVIDCPSLTRRGKSSADIYMALDIVEALAQQHPPFDEFIIMSADADFTPVLFRLRRRDRRTLVIAPSMASAAYTGIAEAVVDTDDFVSQALDSEDPGLTQPIPESTRRHVDESGSSGAPVDPATAGRIREAALRSIKKQLDDSGGPLPAPTVAHSLRAGFPNATWFGYANFRSFLENHLGDIGLCQDIDGARHVIYDPAVHELPALAAVAAARHLIDQEEQPELHELAQRLRRLANVPPLSRSAHATLFRIVGAVVQEGRVQNLNGLTKEVRDRILTEGFHVPRRAINRVVGGLRSEGADFGDLNADWTPSSLAEKYRHSVLSVADDAALDLDEDQIRLLNEWLHGEKCPPSASSPN